MFMFATENEFRKCWCCVFTRFLCYTITFILNFVKARLDRPNDGSRSAGEGLCVLQSFLFTTQQEH